jgi:RNA polymerase sigma factor (TIGR02999 family)
MVSMPGDTAPSADCSLEEITAAVYSELRRLAGGYFRSSPDYITLQPTALVHEVYLRLAAQDAPRWQNRGHFFGIAARCMRQILVDHARSRGAQKRGGGATRGDAAELLQIVSAPAAGILELDDALQALSQLDSRKGRMIELHYFGGLQYDEIAETMAVSITTVQREVKIARAWLMNELGPRLQ